MSALNANIRDLMKSRQGRDVIWHILVMCGVYSGCVTGNPELAEYQNGRRSVGLDIIGMLEESDPTGYARLLLLKRKEEDVQDD